MYFCVKLKKKHFKLNSKFYPSILIATRKAASACKLLLGIATRNHMLIGYRSYTTGISNITTYIWLHLNEKGAHL